MSLIDNFINRATDTAKLAAARHDHSRRRQALLHQITVQESVIAQASDEIGHLAVAAIDAGRPLPSDVAPAGPAIKQWREELRQLHDELRNVDALMTRS
jgi:hypothetical protein